MIPVTAKRLTVSLWAPRNFAASSILSVFISNLLGHVIFVNLIQESRDTVSQVVALMRNLVGCTLRNKLSECF